MIDWSARGSGIAPKLGFSGQKPVSITPTITPSPAWSGSPNCFCHTPFGPSRPRNVGVVMVSTVWILLLYTLTTPGVALTFATSAVVSLAANPFHAVL